MSEIVNNFYSDLEKLGLKKHKHNQEELDYLNSLGESKQLDAFDDECTYNITRLNYKFYMSRILSLILLVMSIYLSSLIWIIPTLMFIISLILIVVSNKLDTSLFIWKAQRGIFYYAKEEIQLKEKEEELRKMFR